MESYQTLKINPSKSEILNINIDQKEEQCLQEKIPFKWQKKYKYLGTYLTVKWKDIYQTNCFPLLNEINKEVRNISRRSLSWVGWINIRKMGIVPKVLLIPLTGTNYFPPGNETLFKGWIKKKNAQLKDTMKEGVICTIQNVRHKRDILSTNELRYDQLTHSLATLP